MKPFTSLAIAILLIVSSSSLADDTIDPNDSIDINSSGDDHNGNIVINYPSSAAGLYHYAPQQHGMLEVNQKLDTIIKLVENAFGKIAERVERVEQKLAKVETVFSDFDRKLDQLKSDQSSSQYITEKVNKLYNINTETYRICKDAVQSPSNKGSNIFIPGMNSRSRHSTGSDSIIVENGGQSSTSDKIPGSAIPKRTEEQEAMVYVISAVANVTLEKYVNLMERKLSEEMNVLNYHIREKLDSTEESMAKVKKVSKDLLDANDQINSALLELKEQISDEQTLIETMDSKISNKFEMLKQATEQKSIDNVGKSQTCCSAQNTTAILEAHIRSLFEEYINKLIAAKSETSVKSNEIVHNSSDKTTRTGKEYQESTQPRSASGSSIASTYRPTKQPIKFVTISASGNEEHHPDHSPTDHNDGRSRSEKSPLKPEFRPAKITNSARMSCTTKSAVSYPKSCAELREHGATCDAVYVIIMQKYELKHVYCDMKHVQGGWTVILRRGRFHTKQITFDHTYPAYKAGFGDMHLGEFFLGLDTIHQLTRDEPHILQVDLEDSEGEYISFQYKGFKIGGLSDDYRLYVDKVLDHEQGQTHISVAHYRQLANVILTNNGSAFMTADRVRKYLSSKDHSIPPNQSLSFIGDCAQLFQSGWWYGQDMLPFSISKHDACKMANGFQLMAPMEKHTARNGRSHGHSYQQQVPLAQHSSHSHSNSHGLSMFWSKWTHTDGTPRIIKNVIMKIRPVSFGSKSQS